MERNPIFVFLVYFFHRFDFVFLDEKICKTSFRGQKTKSSQMIAQVSKVLQVFMRNKNND